ncbi:hypothetical protein J2S96_001852 [Arthrobacter bambusae]|nr:hypothetical protein [Arthrobacter bambusae]
MRSQPKAPNAARAKGSVPAPTRYLPDDALLTRRLGKFLTTPESARREQFSVSPAHLGVEISPRSTAMHSYPKAPNAAHAKGSGPVPTHYFPVTSAFGCRKQPTIHRDALLPEGPQRRSRQRFRSGSDALLSWRHGKFLTTPESARRQAIWVSPAYLSVEKRGHPGDFPPEAVLPKGAHRGTSWAGGRSATAGAQLCRV